MFGRRSIRCYLLSLFLALSVVATSAMQQHQHGRALDPTVVVSTGSQVATSQDRHTWWKTLTAETRDKLTAIYDPDWLASIDEETQIAYLHLANALYTFIESGADAHSDDSYTSFAPILLRAAFHSSGSYFLPDGSGGSNGGTIFHHGELQDDRNGCIATAARQLETLFAGHDLVPLSDAVIVAGTVALDVMEFPRMDLVRVQGGRDMLSPGTTFRDRLPSADHDPLEHLTQHYGLTLSELTAFIGGAHNFGSAHGKCSGYVGQWTATPLSWFGVGGSDPTFFTDLLREDWRWYEVCTFYNDTVLYKSIDDPFAGSGTGEEELDEQDTAGSIPLGCPIMQSKEPLICEKQAMRGCDFKDGVYALGEPPCDINLLQFRLKSDFFLRENPHLLPHAEAFAVDPERLAQEFGMAFRKVTHLGLDRCGMNGHGCSEGTICAASLADLAFVAQSGSKVCVLDEAFVEDLQFDNDNDSSNEMSKETVRLILIVCALVVLVSITIVIVVYTKLLRLNAMAKPKLNCKMAPFGNDASKEDASDKTVINRSSALTNDHHSATRKWLEL